ncbi:hypothetical protein [Mesorhizobium sp.]|uniref:hypothetical protein n=1 Tax=Mesorhizobium sp. TaxID=1871066 RepID=UPI0011F98265|nr:hypothetical protein [Mesorhizobium sp.]TIX23876.1 MAG: hypothetical protein E5V35_20505 [Mesorhizobium sp.]
MSESDPPSFHLRLPPHLKAKLNAERGRNSLNREIIERLERTFEPDPSQHLADIFRPFLAKLNENDRARVLDLATAAGKIIAKGARKRR